jgi:hypothetical protein
VKRLEEWPYSNYLEWIGKRQGTLVDRDFVEEFFDSAAVYQDFVRNFLIMHEIPMELGEYLED